VIVIINMFHFQFQFDQVKSSQGKEGVMVVLPIVLDLSLCGSVIDIHNGILLHVEVSLQQRPLLRSVRVGQPARKKKWASEKILTKIGVSPSCAPNGQISSRCQYCARQGCRWTKLYREGSAEYLPT
jgi:hypothetical protein